MYQASLALSNLSSMLFIWLVAGRAVFSQLSAMFQCFLLIVVVPELSGGPLKMSHTNILQMNHLEQTFQT